MILSTQKRFRNCGVMGQNKNIARYKCATTSFSGKVPVLYVMCCLIFITMRRLMLSCGRVIYLTFHCSHFQSKTPEIVWGQFVKLLTLGQAINKNFLKYKCNVIIPTGRPFSSENSGTKTGRHICDDLTVDDSAIKGSIMAESIFCSFPSQHWYTFAAFVR